MVMATISCIGLLYAPYNGQFALIVISVYLGRFIEVGLNLVCFEEKICIFDDWKCGL